MKRKILAAVLILQSCALMDKGAPQVDRSSASPKAEAPPDTDHDGPLEKPKQKVDKKPPATITLMEAPAAVTGNKNSLEPKTPEKPVGGDDGRFAAKNREDTETGVLLQHYGVNPTIDTAAERTSTFAADVDTGSYTLARGYLERDQLPPEAAVRVEEFVNAFDYGYRPPER